ncbi:hypothetical protein ABIQ69_14910 [Agromyces sp. G08B096]|uniref:Uncharacterized protein n=1 Tax=Agromyces sp. G08B096 TaxID=3156399 RepID=A0AAU7W598_9MICO
MPYTPAPHLPRHDPEALRRRIPGWGVDLDPADRPAVPRELALTVEDTGAHWDLPEPQPEHAPRERSIEHLMLPPVFGTAAPLHGLSGRIRAFAYRRYSEGRAAHWLLLILGDRVEAAGSHLRSFVSKRPDNLLTETGVLSERRRHGVASRFGRGRADLSHQWIDPILVAGPWLLAVAGAAVVGRALVRRRR